MRITCAKTGQPHTRKPVFATSRRFLAGDAAKLQTGLQTALQALDDAMAALDFERALALCQALTEEVEQ